MNRQTGLAIALVVFLLSLGLFSYVALVNPRDAKKAEEQKTEKQKTEEKVEKQPYQYWGASLPQYYIDGVGYSEKGGPAGRFQFLVHDFQYVGTRTNHFAFRLLVPGEKDGEVRRLGEEAYLKGNKLEGDGASFTFGHSPEGERMATGTITIDGEKCPAILLVIPGASARPKRVDWPE